MRDVAVVSFVQSAVARDAVHNEVEMLSPTLHAAMTRPSSTSAAAPTGNCEYGAYA